MSLTVTSPLLTAWARVGSLPGRTARTRARRTHLTVCGIAGGVGLSVRHLKIAENRGCRLLSGETQAARS
jgi:hypothetical protein